MDFKHHIISLLFIYIIVVLQFLDPVQVLAANDDSVDGSCVDDDGTSCSNTNTNEIMGAGLFPSMEFLKEAVFGQHDADNSDSFLTMLDDDDDDDDDDDGTEKKDNNNDNPFLSFYNGILQSTKSAIGTEEGEENTNAIISQLLDKARILTQEEDHIVGIEFLKRINIALQEVTKQMKDHFGTLYDDVDASLPLSMPYFAAKEDSRMSPLWKRRMHRFYNKVTKADLIQLHDALYLSHLAYVDTVKQFRDGLAKFQNNSWEILYGTTDSLPDLPANFLLIHKQLAPLEEPSIKAFFEAKKESEVLVTLVVRGTKHISDVLSDGLLEAKNYRGGKAHGGILSSGKNLAEYYLPKLEELHRTTGRDKIRLVIIGHSLGAGTAAIAAMELKEHNFLEVEAVGFGCPSLLSRELSTSTKDYITTVVNDADIVPRMSGASMHNVILDLIEYDWTDDALEDVEFTLRRGRDSLDFGSLLPDTDKVLNWIRDYLNKKILPKYNNIERKERLPSVLIPPGQCIHIFRDGYGFTSTYTPCDFFASVDFSPTLFDDHLIPTGYQRAVLSAVQDSDRDYSVSLEYSNAFEIDVW